MERGLKTLNFSKIESSSITKKILRHNYMKLKLADGISRRRHAMSTKFWRRLYSPHDATQATAVAELTMGRSETERALTLTYKRFAVR